MALLKIKKDKILDNIKFLDKYFEEKKRKWTLVLKVLGGNKELLRHILDKKLLKNVHSIGDSRLSNLRAIKEVSEDFVTMFLKPPIVSAAAKTVAFSDISLNTSRETIEALNKEAKKQKKIHKVIIMIELGELREGILRENTLNFYSKVFNLSNIDVIGIGTNLGCMYGIEPTYDKLMQLNLFNELIKAKFNKKLELVSGGSSITLPVLEQGPVPPGINHFRIGEAVFLGTSPFDNSPFMDLHDDAFTFHSNIIELKKKPSSPDGIIGEGNVGHVSEDAQKNENEQYEKHFRAIMDFGTIDIDPEEELTCFDKNVNYIGTTSDMTVFEIGKKKGDHNMGECLAFKPNYMGVAKLMYSSHIKKIIE